MKLTFRILGCLASFLPVVTIQAIMQKPIAIIIPSYNNEQVCQINLESVKVQNYSNYHVFYIDDCSTDRTCDLVREFIQEHGLQDRITLIQNTERHGALYNIYHAIHACKDEAIILTLDGDDMLANNEVLTVVNYVYADPNVWLTYGQFIEFPSQQIGFCAAIPYHIVMQNRFREYQAPISHLRTFYAWLFKKINKEDLMYEGDFFAMTWDKAMMWPMLEMCGSRFRFISDILYVYNNANPINDHKVDHALQMRLHRHIKDMKCYQPLPSRE